MKKRLQKTKVMRSQRKKKLIISFVCSLIAVQILSGIQNPVTVKADEITEIQKTENQDLLFQQYREVLKDTSVIHYRVYDVNNDNIMDLLYTTETDIHLVMGIAEPNPQDGYKTQEFVVPRIFFESEESEPSLNGTKQELEKTSGTMLFISDSLIGFFLPYRQIQIETETAVTSEDIEFSQEFFQEGLEEVKETVSVNNGIELSLEDTNAKNEILSDPVQKNIFEYEFQMFQILPEQNSNYSLIEFIKENNPEESYWVNEDKYFLEEPFIDLEENLVYDQYEYKILFQIEFLKSSEEETVKIIPYLSRLLSSSTDVTIPVKEIEKKALTDYIKTPGDEKDNYFRLYTYIDAFMNGLLLQDQQENSSICILSDDDINREYTMENLLADLPISNSEEISSENSKENEMDAPSEESSLPEEPEEILEEKVLERSPIPEDKNDKENNSSNDTSDDNSSGDNDANDNEKDIISQITISDPVSIESEPEPIPIEPEQEVLEEKPVIHLSNVLSNTLSNPLTNIGEEKEDKKEEKEESLPIFESLNHKGFYLIDKNKTLEDGSIFHSLSVESGSKATLVKDLLKRNGITHFHYTIYDFELYNAEGKSLHQLTKDVTMLISKPFEPSEGYTIKVYRVDKDKLIPCQATLDAQTIAFQTDHFSLYIFTEELDDGKNTINVESNENLELIQNNVEDIPRLGDVSSTGNYTIMIGVLILLTALFRKKRY